MLCQRLLRIVIHMELVCPCPFLLRAIYAGSFKICLLVRTKMCVCVCVFIICEGEAF
jgi:hypothetical protein